VSGHSLFAPCHTVKSASNDAINDGCPEHVNIPSCCHNDGDGSTRLSSTSFGPCRRSSQYHGSDTLSLASSDEDHWGTQIGGYNERDVGYPPPPVVLHVPQGALQGAKTVDTVELEAMLERGFDNSVQRLPGPPHPIRYTLTGSSTTQLLHHRYNPISQSPSQGRLNTIISPTSPTMNMRRATADWPYIQELILTAKARLGMVGRTVWEWSGNCHVCHVYVGMLSWSVNGLENVWK
jgi:hypothetical protein